MKEEIKQLEEQIATLLGVPFSTEEKYLKDLLNIMAQHRLTTFFTNDEANRLQICRKILDVYRLESPESDRRRHLIEILTMYFGRLQQTV